MKTQRNLSAKKIMVGAKQRLADKLHQFIRKCQELTYLAFLSAVDLSESADGIHDQIDEVVKEGIDDLNDLRYEISAINAEAAGRLARTPCPGPEQQPPEMEKRK